MIKKTNLFYLAVLVLASCAGLQTREEGSLKSKSSPIVKRSRTDLQTENASLKAKVLDYEEQFRALSGKVEELEILNRRLQEGNQKILGEENKEIAAYKESVAELVEEKKKLEKQLVLLQEENKAADKALADAKKTAQDHLDKGDALFDDKKWSEAVSEYQNFREKSKDKKSEDYALATYKIGVCFQELGMVKEAKTFYQSVVSKHKGLKAAKYATYRLSNL